MDAVLRLPKTDLKIILDLTFKEDPLLKIFGAGGPHGFAVRIIAKTTKHCK